LKTAAIPKYTREGKVDFHALRLAYINFVLESGQPNGLGRWYQSKKTVPEVCPNTLILPLKVKSIIRYFKRLKLG